MQVNQVTIRDLRLRGLELLKGSQSASIDRDLILMHLLNKDKSFLISHDDEVVNEEIYEKYIELINDRKNNKPIAYILNSKEFMGLEFYVDENVLIPRPDTEVIVEKVIDIIDENYKNFENIEVLDLCSGSGAIGISILSFSKIKNISLIGSDISKEALKISTKNARMNGVLEKYQNIESDLFNNLSNKKFDIIVSNPPYIRKDVVDTLDKDVKEFEPHLALIGGEDGLDFYREITKESIKYLKSNGFLVFEIGYDQGEDVKNLLINAAFRDVGLIKDLSNKDRCVFGHI